MKKKVFLTVFLFFTMGSFLLNPAMADWVDIPGVVVSYDASTPLPEPPEGTGEKVFEVVVSNTSGADIEGDIRIFIDLLVDTPDPLNATEITDDSSLYYDLATGQIDLFEMDEVVRFEVIFPTEYVVGVSSFELDPKINNAAEQKVIFRKKISKTPELYSGEALIQTVERYVPASNTSGELLYKTPETDGFIACEDLNNDGVVDCPENNWEGGTITLVKPLVVSYLQEIEGTDFNSVPDFGVEGNRLAHDVYAAVSLDQGATWKRKNISKTSEKSSFKLPNGVDYPGDSESIAMAIASNDILVSWVDKFCQSGNPWGMPADWEDPYQAMGPQRSVDYLDVKGDDEPRPDLGVRPFSCVWAARGVLQTDPQHELFGTVLWYKGEQISTGRRDAIRNFAAAEERSTLPYFDFGDPIFPADFSEFSLEFQFHPPVFSPGGFAITWQEDPKGLKTGKGRGPGAGMSGASVNHKTDIWYSYLKFDDFEVIDPEFVPSSEGENDSKPHPLFRFSTPVRITDNAVCKERTTTPIVAHIHDPAVEDCDYSYEGGTTKNPILFEDLPEEWVCPKCGRLKSTFSDVAVFVGNRNEGSPYCNRFAANPRVDGYGNVVNPGDPGYEIAYYTSDSGEPLDGNTGASRANLSLVNWQGDTLALVAYEETKGIGVGGDKEASAAEQAAPFPIVYQTEAPVYAGDKESDAGVDWEGWTGGFNNRDCRSCHYDHVVPRDRFIPVPDPVICEKPVSEGGKGAIWKDDTVAYFPYSGYPYSVEYPTARAPLDCLTDPACDPLDYLPPEVAVLTTTKATKCVKFEQGTNIFPRDWAQTEPGLYVLPDQLPGWHSENIDCTKCHVAKGTKDYDNDGVLDSVDKCPGTEEGVEVDLVPDSETYGCSIDQEVGDIKEPKYRHGKNIYFHHFPFDLPATIAHGDQINIENQHGWVAPGTNSRDENARRVRLVPNTMYGADGADITLGLLYKQGKDGQGAPADAMIRFFRNGFDIGNIDNGALNLSSSTPYLYKPEENDTDPALVDYGSGDGTDDLISGHKTPNIEHFYWTQENLNDPSGYWYEDATTGEKLWTTDVLDNIAPQIRANPFDNVFSTRLDIRGNFVAVGFAYSTNWAAARNAKDHYDFYVRSSDDGGINWTLPVNVSGLKNHKESVSDCRLLLPPTTLFPAGANAYNYFLPFFYDMPRHDFFNKDNFFVAIGTKENVAQPAPNETELEESEIFLDLTYSRTTDRGVTFESVFKDNPKYVEGALQYLDNLTGEPTDSQFDAFGVENLINPEFGELIDDFDWIAKGDAFQGDIQVVSDPAGSILHASWEQELAIDEESSMSHFQGTDVWYRKVNYGLPMLGDLDGNEIIDINDIIELRTYLNQLSTACPACDINGNGLITGRDLRDLRRMCTYRRCRSN